MAARPSAASDKADIVSPVATPITQTVAWASCPCPLPNGKWSLCSPDGCRSTNRHRPVWHDLAPV